MTRALTSKGLACLITCAAVAGCASMAQPFGNAVVSAAPCPPETQVGVDVTVSGSLVSVMVPDPAKVYKNGGGIRWTLHSQGSQSFAFTSDGIVLKAGSPSGSGSPSSWKPSEYVWCFNSTTLGNTWDYSIKFFDPAAPLKVWTCDPTIVSSDSFTVASGLGNFTCS